MRYAIKLEPDTNDTILVTFPDIPEAHTFGEDEDDALLRAVDALEAVIQGYMTDRRPIPLPKKKGRHYVDLRTQATLKVLLYNRMLEQGVSKARLARDLRLHRPQVDRLLDLRHSSRLDQIDAALASLGARVTVEIEAA